MIRQDIRDAADALGPPIFGLRGRRLRTNSSCGGPNSLSLSFGRFGCSVTVETSTELIDDDRMLLELVLMLDPEFPLVINESSFELELDGRPISLAGFVVDDNWWCGTAVVDDRWIYVRAIDSPRAGISLRTVAI